MIKIAVKRMFKRVVVAGLTMSLMFSGVIGIRRNMNHNTDTVLTVQAASNGITVYSQLYRRWSGTSFGLYPAFAKKYGDKYGIKYERSVSKLADTKSHLMNGGTAVIRVTGHLMALVDYNSKNGKYLVIDSYDSVSRGTKGLGYRWMNASEFTGKMQFRTAMLLKSTVKHVDHSSTGENAKNNTKQNSKTYEKNITPIGCIDVCSGGKGEFSVSGWAYDPDSPSSSVRVDI